MLHYSNEQKIVGFEFFSKNGRVDSFGTIKSKGKSFNYGIRRPEKPIVTFGTFNVGAGNVSWVSKLGFEVA